MFECIVVTFVVLHYQVVEKAPAYALHWEEHNVHRNVKQITRTTFVTPSFINKDDALQEQTDTAQVRGVYPSSGSTGIRHGRNRPT